MVSDPRERERNGEMKERESREGSDTTDTEYIGYFGVASDSCGLKELLLPLDIYREGLDNMPGDESFLDSAEFADLTSANRALLSYAFDHAGDPLPVTKKPSKKKRKTESIEPEDITAMPEVEAGGGFVTEDDDERGGFVMDDDGEEGGGFIVDEEEDDAGGGFLMDDEDQNGGGFLPDPDIEVVESNQADISTPSSTDESRPRSAKTHIPLSLIPRALKLANLPPSDMEVLEFFKQSAEGWSDDTDLNTAGAASRLGGGGGSRRRVHEEKGVSRRDWFSVCAILLASREEEGENDDNSEDQQDEEEEEEDEVGGDEEDDEDDEWMEDDPDQAGGFIASPKSRLTEQGEDEDDIFNPNRRRTRRNTRSAAVASPVPSLPSSEDGDDDETAYSESGASNKKSAKLAKGAKPVGKLKGRKTKRMLLDEDMIGDIDLTKDEKRRAKEAWSMFFTDDQKSSKAIGFKEVWEAARVLKEGWNQAQVKEMIASFSSAPDKSVLSLDDFEKLMWQGGMLA
ncbi:EF-hand domain pair [Phaffia rhodozyma]|uniref:EF-hand domain pair n=1 Tax=Phaffia rhodozyma TaxID=264483 RepID=A0A0F7SUF3_PHARH|nr:EF-hand domain pair [Phaffia rhodozyma]